MADETMMLDTNVFNHLLDGSINPAQFAGKVLVATHVQRDEINQTRDPNRRASLHQLFAQTISKEAATSSMVAGISVAGSACPSDGELLLRMKNELDKHNGDQRGNNMKDALIAETALRNGWTLVSNDADLIDVATRHLGGVRGA
jgi:predicted nucleic acid-binding protein